MTLQRRTPLRTSIDSARAWERRSRKPLPAEGAKAKRERRDVAAFRKGVLERAGGRCELATPDCPPGAHAGAHAHHVFAGDRDRGAHDPARGLWCCAAGHGWVHTHPEMAYELGWLGRG